MNHRTLFSTEPVNGELRIQRKTELNGSWEFCVGKKEELSKVPAYPVTSRVSKPGIQVTLKSGTNEVAAAFHGFDEHFYIGSARKLLGSKQTKAYRAFLRNFGVNIGVDTDKIPVKLDFRAGNIVYVSRR